MSGVLPLLTPRDLAAPMAWRDGRPISAACFIAEAEAFAERLPAHGSPVNLCQDRYLFALGLAAALLRGQTSLMPPNALPETLRQLPADLGKPYALTDDGALDLGGLSGIVVTRPDPVAPATAVPMIHADQQAVCLLTSGSTGLPQPHAKRWGALVANIAAEAERLAELIGRPSIAGLNVLATVPAQHSYGFESSVLLAMLGGAVFDAGRPFYPADIADALARLPAPRALVTTPFHLKTLLLAHVALPQVDLVLSATAPLSPQLAEQAEAAFGARLVEIYGCTEAGQVAARRTTDGDIWTALGALRLWSEQHDGAERFCVAGGHVLEATPLADVLELHDERRFRLLGRANDLIHVAGKRSSLAHLNFQLNRIPGVDDGAFWLPDDVADAVVRPVVFVVAPSLTAREVVLGLRERLEAAFVPRQVVHVASLPREATGKLTAQVLAQFARSTLGGQERHVIEVSEASETGDADPNLFHVPADHPAFAGHFPGQPVLPGVVLLSLVMQSLEQQPALRARVGAAPCLDQAKFLVPVGPGAELRVSWRELPRGLAFEVREDVTAGAAPDQRAVARGQLS